MMSGKTSSVVISNNYVTDPANILQNSVVLFFSTQKFYGCLHPMMSLHKFYSEKICIMQWLVIKFSATISHTV